MSVTVGLTGGIGSGKTLIANLFAQTFSIPIYIADQASKELISQNPLIQEQLNAIIHPYVQENFLQWKLQQVAPYVIKESAILFESGSYKDCDYIITVTAPIEERIRRVMFRDKIDRETIEKRIKNQWEEQKKIELSTFVIENNEIDKNLDKIQKVHFKIMKMIDENAIN